MQYIIYLRLNIKTIYLEVPRIQIADLSTTLKFKTITFPNRSCHSVNDIQTYLFYYTCNYCTIFINHNLLVVWLCSKEFIAIDSYFEHSFTILHLCRESVVRISSYYLSQACNMWYLKTRNVLQNYGIFFFLSHCKSNTKGIYSLKLTWATVHTNTFS